MESKATKPTAFGRLVCATLQPSLKNNLAIYLYTNESRNEIAFADPKISSIVNFL